MKKAFVLIIFSFLVVISNAQKFSSIWDKNIYNKKDHNEYMEFLAQNDNYFYARFLTKKYENVISAYSISTFEEASSIQVGELEKANVELKKARIVYYFAKNSNFYILYQLKKGTNFKYYLVVASADLSEVKEPVLICDMKSYGTPTNYYFNESINGELYVVLSYMHADKFQHIFYTVLNGNEVTKSGDFSLDVKKEKSLSLYVNTDNIQLSISPNGDIFGKLFAKLPKSESEGNGDFGRNFNLIFWVNVAQNSIKKIPLIDREINFYNSFVDFNTNNEPLIYSFISRKKDDPNGDKITDLFCAKVEEKTLNFSAVNFTPLKLEYFGIEQKKDSIETTEDEIYGVSNIYFEKTIKVPNGNNILLATNSYDFTNNESNRCQKSGFTLLELDKSNKLIYGEYVPRNYTFIGSSVKDINCILKDDNLVVMFQDLLDSKGNKHLFTMLDELPTNELDYVSYDFKNHKTRREFFTANKTSDIKLNYMQNKSDVIIMEYTTKSSVQFGKIMLTK